ncbi:MAG: GHMP kinase, partial [Patescibacteria group bacterium]
PQDQYAAAFGGFNELQFNSDDTVSVRPNFIDFKKRMALEKNTLLFFTGMTRLASSVLSEQKANIDKKFETLKQMADSVPDFIKHLQNGDIKSMGEMLHEGWQRKKSLASNVSNPLIDELYEAGMKNGAWGGKVLGAGGGGCIMFLADPTKHAAIRLAAQKITDQHKLTDFQELPIHFVQSGAEVLYHGDVSRPILA